MKIKVALFFITLLNVNVSYAQKWNKSNNPAYFNAIAKNKLVTKFKDLPLEGKIQDERLGWSETYWPSNLGSIAYRWNHPDPKPFEYKLHSKEEIERMSLEEISELSPAELYDIFMGDYEYTLTKKVLSKNSLTDLWWEGICHGWALASLHYPEPEQVELRNPDGIIVPFGSSDVKALLSLHDAHNSKGFYVRVGDRCNVPGKVPGEESSRDSYTSFPRERDAQKADCSDVNAGSFHIVLTSMIGINSQGFVADVDRFNDVWNQPVVSYTSEQVELMEPDSKEKRTGVSLKVHMKTIMTYGEELEFYTPEKEAEGALGFVSKLPVTGTPAQMFKSKTYEYTLDLDGEGKIIGGEWISLTRPDMLWMKAKETRFHNGGAGGMPLEGLNRIYRPRQ